MSREWKQVKVNQVWVAKGADDVVMRRLRLLAPHPDGGWLYFTLAPDTRRPFFPEYGCCPENNLHIAFTLEKDVCDHRGPLLDQYGTGTEDIPPAVPNYYKCSQCGDIFPNHGDTCLWFPKVLERIP